MSTIRIWQALKWVMVATLRFLVSRAIARYGPLYLPEEVSDEQDTQFN